MLDKAISHINGRAAKQTKPRFESVLKDRPRRSAGLKHQRPGASQTQEAFAREWRQSNNLHLVS